MNKNTKTIIIAVAVIAVLAVAAFLIFGQAKTGTLTINSAVTDNGAPVPDTFQVSVKNSAGKSAKEDGSLVESADPVYVNIPKAGSVQIKNLPFDTYAVTVYGEGAAIEGYDLTIDEKFAANVLDKDHKDITATLTYIYKPVYQETAGEIITAFDKLGQIEGTMDAELGLSLEADALTEIMTMTGGSAGGMEQILKPIASVISNLKIRALTDKEGIQLNLKLKDTDLAAVGVKAAEDGKLAIVSDLLPGYVLKADLPKAGVPNVGAIKLTAEEQKAIFEAIKAKADKFEEDIKAKAGEAEKGSWFFDDATFTEKKPINITTKEATIMTLNFLKDLFTDPSMKKITDAMGEKFDVSKIDSAIADVEKKEDKDFPVLTWNNYTNSSKNEYHEVSLTKEAKKVDFAASLIGKTLKVHANIDANGKAAIEGVVDAESLDANVTADITTDKLAAKIVADLIGQKDGSFDGNFTVSMNDKKVLGFSLTAKGTSEKMSVSFDETDKKVVALEEMGSSEDGKALSNALTVSLPGILQKAMQAMPDEVNTLTMLFGGGLQ